MKKSDWRYLVDVLLFTCLGGMIVIGVLMGLVIPTGPAAAESSKYFLGLHRHQWGNIHAYLSIAFVVLMIVHLILNWEWITSKTSQIFKRRSAPILVSAVFAPFLVLLVFWLLTPKDAATYEGYGIDAPGRGRMREAIAREEAPVAGESLVERMLKE